MHLSQIYCGEWVEQEQLLFRAASNATTPLAKNSPSTNDGLFASTEPLTKVDVETFGGHQWMMVVKRYYQINTTVIFDPEDVIEFVKL